VLSTNCKNKPKTQRPFSPCPQHLPTIWHNWTSLRTFYNILTHYSTRFTSSQPARYTSRDTIHECARGNLNQIINNRLRGHPERSPRSCFRKKARGRSRGFYSKTPIARANAQVAPNKNRNFQNFFYSLPDNHLRPSATPKIPQISSNSRRSV
jgi:hypothetical protein